MAYPQSNGGEYAGAYPAPNVIQPRQPQQRFDDHQIYRGSSFAQHQPSHQQQVMQRYPQSSEQQFAPQFAYPPPDLYSASGTIGLNGYPQYPPQILRPPQQYYAPTQPAQQHISVVDQQPNQYSEYYVPREPSLQHIGYRRTQGSSTPASSQLSDSSQPVFTRYPSQPQPAPGIYTAQPRSDYRRTHQGDGRMELSSHYTGSLGKTTNLQTQQSLDKTSNPVGFKYVEGPVVQPPSDLARAKSSPKNTATTIDRRPLVSADVAKLPIHEPDTSTERLLVEIENLEKSFKHQFKELRLAVQQEIDLVKFRAASFWGHIVSDQPIEAYNRLLSEHEIDQLQLIAARKSHAVSPKSTIRQTNPERQYPAGLKVMRVQPGSYVHVMMPTKPCLDVDLQPFLWAQILHLDRDKPQETVSWIKIFDGTSKEWLVQQFSYYPPPRIIERSKTTAGQSNTTSPVAPAIAEEKSQSLTKKTGDENLAASATDGGNAVVVPEETYHSAEEDNADDDEALSEPDTFLANLMTPI